jgi:hypothetical protein
MAWIKVDHDLHDKPEVAAIAAALGLDIDTVVGKLLRVWQWFDRHTHDGCANVALEFHDRIAQHSGFASAMQKVGWLIARKGGVITVPKFDRHNSKSAKRRVLAAETMQRSRCANVARKAQPDKRREDKSIKESKQRKKPAFQKPTIDEVAAYCRERSNGIDAQSFLDHYEAADWKRGKSQTPITDWKACVRTWEAGQRKAVVVPRLPTPEEDAEWTP